MSDSIKEKVTYIYNFDQINFYLKNGVYPLEIGVHPQSRRAWCKFSWNGSTNIFTEWCNRKAILNKLKKEG